ncbi:MAG TPA: hypothetical protein VGA13_13905 [Acidimicrobiales bacterium]
MSSPTSALIDELAGFSAWWLAEAGSHAADMAARAGAGTYGVEDAASDLARCAAISVLGAAGLGFELVGILTMIRDSTASDQATASVAVEPESHPRQLSLVTPFISVFGDVTIPPSRISFDPALLPAGATSFDVNADTTGLDKVAYQGTVMVGGPPPATNITASISTHKVWLLA